jgi:glycerol uptake facilitator-like aquaporin
MFKHILAEFLGTFVLVAAILFTGKPLFIAAGFLIAIAMVGPLSGGHINPAVSLAMVLKGDLPWTELPQYIMAQIAGALLALALYKGIKRAT